MSLKYINFHETFPINNKGRDFFVGDIHGNYNLFMFQLKQKKFDPEIDRVFSCGDIIDRGEDSPRCIELLNQPWFNAVLGNHEDMLLSIHENPRILAKYLAVGGGWINEFIDDPKKLMFLINTVRAKMFFSFTIKTNQGSIGLIHGQGPNNWQDITRRLLSEDDVFDCMWSIEKFSLSSPLDNNIENIDLVVSGHVNCEAVTVIGNQVWIDTLRSTNKLAILTSDELFKMVDHA